MGFLTLGFRKPGLAGSGAGPRRERRPAHAAGQRGQRAAGPGELLSHDLTRQTTAVQRGGARRLCSSRLVFARVKQRCGEAGLERLETGNGSAAAGSSGRESCGLDSSG